jgi:hypothetical protein
MPKRPVVSMQVLATKPVKTKEDLQSLCPRGRNPFSQVIWQIHFLGDRLAARPEFPLSPRKSL